MDVQRYVSPDLTHFVGRGRKTLREQYLVLKKILKEGRLRTPRPEKLRRAPYVLQIHPSKRLSENEAYRASVVCFCDIPAGDMGLHMRKYGRFGLAFTKDFLLEEGATPVMYIPSTGRPSLPPWDKYGRRRVSSNAVSFDQFWSQYQRLCQAARDGSAGHLLEPVRRVSEFLDVHLLSHLKFFDPLASDWDKKNYYMEREWRVSRDVRFHLGDVRRVILPESYGRRFRRDFPSYDGELVFAD